MEQQAWYGKTGYLDFNFTIFQCKSNRILVFTPVEGFSNILFHFFIYYSSFKLLSVAYIHYLYFLYVIYQLYYKYFPCIIYYKY